MYGRLSGPMPRPSPQVPAVYGGVCNGGGEQRCNYRGRGQNTGGPNIYPSYGQPFYSPGNYFEYSHHGMQQHGQRHEHQHHGDGQQHHGHSQQHHGHRDMFGREVQQEWLEEPELGEETEQVS